MARKSIIEKYYEPEDEYFIVNDNDPDLRAIKINLPKCPDIRKIDGYGLAPADQIWTPPVYPQKLKSLEKKVMERLVSSYNRNKHNRVTGQKLIVGIKEELKTNQAEYEYELNWIKTQWKRRLYGYWLFINGKPTYLDGWQYFYNGFWNLDVGLPDYRDKDRRWFHFARFCYTDTMAFAKYQKDGMVVWETSDNYFVAHYDHNARVCFGFVYPKGRREGATHKSLSIGLEIISRQRGVYGGIQSYNDDNASAHFQDKLIPAWRKMPFFFKPLWDGTDRPQKELKFVAPGNMPLEAELESGIDFATTANRKFYDGKKLFYYQSEEAGKTVLEDINERHQTVKECLAQGAGGNIHGFTISPTTVHEMDNKDGLGGMAFYKLFQASNYYQRVDTSGQTLSGMYRLFIPSWDGLEGFIGPHGESVIETPTEDQARFIRKKIGAKEFIQSKLDTLLRIGTPDAMADYYKFKELYPTCVADCFRIVDGNIGFNVEKMDKRIAELRRMENYYIRGNFEWENGKIDSKVVFKEDIVNGRWTIYHKPLDSQTNLKQKVMHPMFKHGYSWMPTQPGKYTLGADPYKFLGKRDSRVSDTGSKLSKGGGCVFLERDFEIDPEEKPIELWRTHTTAASYLARPKDDDEYAEDMLMANVYFGGLMYPENNIDLIVKHYTERGYQAYLKHDIDERGRIKDRPGFTSLTESKDKLFKFTRTYIEYHIHREMCLEYIVDCKTIKNVEDMTHYDRFTAHGAALLGSASSYHKLLENNKGKDRDPGELFESNYV